MKQDHHELADALAKGYRYDPANKPPLRPGCTVRLRKGNEHTLVRLESDEDVVALTTLDIATKELIGAENPAGASVADSIVEFLDKEFPGEYNH